MVLTRNGICNREINNILGFEVVETDGFSVESVNKCKWQLEA